MEQENDVEASKDSPFYSDARDYWSKVPSTVDGMLGGFGHISKCDIKGSESFLQSIFKLKCPPGCERALDCGAGIGRITKNLLLRYFETIDLVEQNQLFIDDARKFIDSDQVEEYYCCGLQDFKPTHKYDVIWCQWVLGHLADNHFIEFMQNCKMGLKENGVIIVKENITSGKVVNKDTTDSSVTRPLEVLLSLFEKAGLKKVKISNQTSFPKGLYPVKMLALRPEDSTCVS